MKKPLISVVTPVYNAELIILELYRRLKSVLTEITANYEIIMVNDFSPQNDWSVIKSLSKNDKHVKGVSLSKNFGQHVAITAGLQFCTGDWVVVMDCDLQDQPEEIVKLYKKSQEGYDIVVGKRAERKDNFLTKITSKLFYLLFNYLTDQKLDNKVANFGIYSKQVIENIKKYKEKDRSFGLLVSLVGFSRAEIEIVHAQRYNGESSYNLKKRLDMATNLVLSHSIKPLKLFIKLGFFITTCSIIYAIWLFFSHFLFLNSVMGWTSIMVSLYFLAGIIIMVIGMTGLYIGKIYEEVKGRPLYIIDETTFDPIILNKKVNVGGSNAKKNEYNYETLSRFCNR